MAKQKMPETPTGSRTDTVTDISARADVENALLESERRLSTLMSNLPGMAYRCQNNRNWTMEFVSEGCFELTGYKPSEFINDRVVSWNDLMHPEDRQWIYDEVQNALSKKHFYRFVFRLRTKSGQNIWAWEQGVGVYSETGEVLALEGFITDVTEHQEAKRQLYSENLLLRTSMKGSYKFCGIVGRSKVIQKVFDIIMLAGKSNADVILNGESGTGKELVARAIHDLSDRRDCRFVPVNCGAVPENLIESEFFGYKKGAFTGAHMDKQGYLDLADGGTLFLDEVGEIDLNLQVKLLRAIEGSGFTPVGSSDVKKPDFRIIAATNKDLKALIKKGALREDFFYRIHVIPLTLPPLRERKEDIPLLVYHFLEMFTDKNTDVIPQDIMAAFQEYDWPGNIRELQNAVQRYVTLNRIDFIDMDSPAVADPRGFPETVNAASVEERPLQAVVEEVEKKTILGLLEKHRWHRGDVAAVLDINYRTLLRKIKKYDLNCHK
jgi:PAS domain S-box-containing protein